MLSFFVLAFSFILHAMVVSFVMSTLVRKVTSQDTTSDMHKSSIETTVNSVGDLEKRLSLITKLPMIQEQLRSIEINNDPNNDVFT